MPNVFVIDIDGGNRRQFTARKDAVQVHRDLEGRKTTGSVVMLP